MAIEEELRKEPEEESLPNVKEKSKEDENILNAIRDELHQYLDIPLTVSTELGRTDITVREVLKLREGSVISLDKLVGEPIEIYINGLLSAKGEVVVVNDRFGIRVTDVIDPMDIIRQRV